MTAQIPDEKIIEEIKAQAYRFSLLEKEVAKRIVGHTEIIQFIMIALLCDGHILLEGVPGVAKTTMIKAVTQALGLSFKRIQFTPDLLPSDLIGTLIFNQKTHEFETKKGPIFANLILADEINRAPAKVQAALLEAMQEGQVTIGSTTYTLDAPFLVFATQNPVEQEGTYRLPEAQIDRFMFKLNVGYPTYEQEKQIIATNAQRQLISQVISKDELLKAQKLIDQIYIDEKIIDYIVNIVFTTRMPGSYGLKKLSALIHYGVSPRATLALHHAARAHAFLHQRHFVTPDDVKAVCHAVLRHRLPLTYEAEAENKTADQLISSIISTITAP